MIKKYKRMMLVKAAVVVFVIASLFGLVTNLQYAHATPIFGVESNVSQEPVSPPGSSPTDIVSSGSDVYIAWQDSGGNLWFGASHDNGATFTSISLIIPSSGISIPKISVAESNVYLSYIDGIDLQLEISTDKGGSFNGGPSGPDVATVAAGGTTTGPPITISIGGASDFSTAASGDRVFMSWINSTDNKIEFATLKNSTGAIDISNTLSVPFPASSPLTPKIKAVGSNVYVAWEDLNADFPNGEIFFSQSSNNGTIFTGPTNLSSTVGSASSAPGLASAGNNVYVVWQEQMASNEILFRASTNHGATFGGTTNLSSNTGESVDPDIAASGNSVYVAWKDDQVAGATLNNDVLFRASTNTGTSFGSTNNLSNDPGDASNVHLSAAGSNVDVTWLDTTINPTPGDVFYKSSADNGLTLGGLKKINSLPVSAPGLIISSSLNHVAITWPAVNAGGSDAFLGVGIPSALSVSFDKTQYALGEAPTLTVKDPASNLSGAVDTIFATVSSSTSDPGGISVLLTETGGNTGVFTRQLHFHAGASNAANATLSAGPTEIIQGMFGGQDAISTTVPVTVALDFAGYDKGDIAHVIVHDDTANVDPGLAETIKVQVTSKRDTHGIPLILTETGPSTGDFGSIGSDKIIFMENYDILPTSGTITVTESNDVANTTPGVDTLVETVTSTSNPGGITLKLNETSGSSAIFTGHLTLTTGPSINHIAIQVAPGDVLTITDGSSSANGLISPYPTSTGALLVNVGATNDAVKVTYRGVTAQATVDNSLVPGGASGGISRASFVFDVVAGTGGSNPVPPTFDLTALAASPGALPDNIRNEVLAHDSLTPISPHNDNSFAYPLIIDGGGYVLGGHTNTIVTRTETTGTPVDLKLNLLVTGLEHLALYTNLRDSSNEIPDSDTYIIYDKGQPLQVVDPHGYFAASGVKFDLDTQNTKNKIEYKITFAKAMEKSDIIFRAWNDRKSTSDVKILNAWEVLTPQQTSQNQLSQPQVIQTPQTPPTPTQMPQTTEPDLMPAIKDWGGFSSNPISDSELLSSMGVTGQSIPQWVATPAKYVVDGDLTPQEFEIIVKYLASQGIIK